MAEALVDSEPIPNVDGDAPIAISDEGYNVAIAVSVAVSDDSEPIEAMFVNGSHITNDGYRPGEELKFGPVSTRLVKIWHQEGFVLPIKVDATVDYDAARMLLDLPEEMSSNPDPWEKEGINEDGVCKATGVMKVVELNPLPQDHGGQNHKGDYWGNWVVE